MSFSQGVPIDTESLLQSIEAMRNQEDVKYRAVDYLHQPIPVSAPINMPLEDAIDADCRFRMSEWCYQIADFCKFKRETVAIAMSCLDRFMSSPAGTEAFFDRSQFQLAAMTAFYTAIKVHEAQAIDPNLVASLSRGSFAVSKIEEMELAILNAIQWHVNPPTALLFLHQYLELIPDNLVSHEMREAVIELAKFQTELAVSDCDFVPINASSIALAALSNSFQAVNLDATLQSHLITVLSEAVRVECSSSLFTDIRIRLLEAMSGQSQSNLVSNLAPQTSCSDTFAKATSSIHGSPRSVSQTTGMI